MSTTLSVTSRIASTGLSEILKDELWFVPTAQSIHIAVLAVVFVCALMISLRLWGIGSTERPLSAVVRKNTTWMYVGLVILLITGSLLAIAEPERQFGSPAFWLKMLLILVSLLMTALLARTVRRDPERWDARGARPGWSRPYAVAYVCAWTAIIFCGRFIGYT